MLIRAATVVQQLCKSCRACFMSHCMFYFTCDHFFSDHVTSHSAAKAPKTSTETLERRHTQASGRNHASNSSKAASVVEPAHERPRVLDGARQQFSDTGNDDDAQRYAEDGVRHGEESTNRSYR